MGGHALSLDIGRPAAPAPATVSAAIADAYPQGARCTSRLLLGIGDFGVVLSSLSLTAEEVVMASFAWETVVHAPDEFYSLRLGRLLREIQDTFVAERGVKPEAMLLWYGLPKKLKPGLHEQAMVLVGRPLSIRHLAAEAAMAMATAEEGFRNIALLGILHGAFLEVESLESDRRHAEDSDYESDDMCTSANRHARASRDRGDDRVRWKDPDEPLMHYYAYLRQYSERI